MDLQYFLFIYLSYFLLGMGLICIVINFIEPNYKLENSFIIIVLFVLLYPILLFVYMWYLFIKRFIGKEENNNE